MIRPTGTKGELIVEKSRRYGNVWKVLGSAIGDKYSIIEVWPKERDRTSTVSVSWMTETMQIVPQDHYYFDNNKENNMGTTTRELRNRIKALEKQAELLISELEAKESREKYGDGNFKPGTVLMFDMKYDTWGKTYSYAIMKAANGKWFATGLSMFNRSKSGTWGQVVEFWEKHSVAADSIGVVVDTTSLDRWNDAMRRFL